jgi:A/G-specific adenine glycosylase
MGRDRRVSASATARPGARTVAGGLPSPTTARALHDRILGWYAEHGRDLPWRRTTDPYAILVSEVMLQQTQVPRVLVRYAPFLERFPTLAALAAASLSDVLAAWLGLGYNARALRLKHCAQAVPDGLPRDLDALLALPGIGPYTARAVLVFAHDADLAAVDANVRRVLTSELALPHDLSPAALQAVADAVLPRGRSRDWHNALMDYGSLVLTARATGIAPRARQTPFHGSPRERRARLLRRLVEGGPLTLAAAAEALGLPLDVCRATAATLVADGLAVDEAGLLRVGDR